MQDRIPFSDEYQMGSTTHSESSDALQVPQTSEEIGDKIRKKIETDYQLAKPRRRITQARIIEDDKN